MLDTRRTTKVSARIIAPCLSCLGACTDATGARTCRGCKGEGHFYINVSEDTVEDVNAWDDGPAWDYVAESVRMNGAEIYDGAWRYSFDSAHHNGSTYELKLKIENYPVSAETIRSLNEMVRNERGGK